MIVGKANGGLGNQFFKYAALKALAIKHDTDIGLDLTPLKGNSKESHFRRKFKLANFNVEFEEVSLKKMKEYIWITGNKYIDDYIIQKFKLFEKNAWYDNDNIDEFKSQSNDVCLLGFFINPKYFEGLRDVFVKEFVLKDQEKIKPLLDDIKKSEYSVSVHVRRGDLLKSDGRGYVLPKSYYQTAMDHICSKVEWPKFYFFSDDIEWCKENFGHDMNDVTFVEGNDVSEDFELMKNCKHNILANSSLSWWVAYLNENYPIVVCPSYFNTHLGSDKHLQLKEWTELV